MRYWALLANPQRYRIEAAVAAGDDDWWTTKGKDIRKGDKAIIWKAKGRSEARGIVALGEVLCDPVYRADTESPFWVVSDCATEDRVLVRYVVPPGLPLWLDERSVDLLGRLNVCRACGGTVFHLRDTEWDDILDRVGSI